MAEIGIAGNYHWAGSNLIQRVGTERFTTGMVIWDLEDRVRQIQASKPRPPQDRNYFRG